MFNPVTHTHPYLARELRLIALTAALRPLPFPRLDSRAARAAAFALAGFADVTPDEHREAAYRARLWLRLFGETSGGPARPSAPAAIAGTAGAPRLACVA